MDRWTDKKIKVIKLINAKNSFILKLFTTNFFTGKIASITLKTFSDAIRIYIIFGKKSLFLAKNYIYTLCYVCNWW